MLKPRYLRYYWIFCRAVPIEVGGKVGKPPIYYPFCPLKLSSHTSLALHLPTLTLYNIIFYGIIDIKKICTMFDQIICTKYL